jgi:probable selenate reductase FAD-binding subunit
MRDLREYHRPSSAAEAVRLKREYGARAVYLGGSTDLLVHRPAGVEAAIDIRHAGIDYVRVDDSEVLIGGGALLRDAEKAVAGVAGGMLRQAVRETAPWLIRNAATLAGNIANASPAADSVPALMVLGARLVLLGEAEEEVSIEDILSGPHRTLLGDRLIREIRVPRTEGVRAAFHKLARSASDIALVNAAVALKLEGDVARDVVIALGAVAPTAIRARQAEAALEGMPPTEELLVEVERVVADEVRPISDWRASEGYRRRMSGVFVRRLLSQALNGEQSRAAA